jgi:ADP-heptose:LPS heptosyltransferase
MASGLSGVSERLAAIAWRAAHTLRECLESVIGLPFPGGRPERLLLVRLDQVGDFILWLDAARQLRAHHPDRRIILVANQQVHDLAVALPYFDQVIPVDVPRFTRDIRYRCRILLRVRALGPGVALQPTYSRVYHVGDSIVRASGAAVRIGSAGDGSNATPAQRRRADRWFTRRIPAAAGMMHEIARNQEFLDGFGVPPAPPRLIRLPADPRAASRRPDGAYVVVAPGTSMALRRWPPDRFAAVAATLAAEFGVRIILVGDATERHITAAVRTAAGLDARDDRTGATSLPDLVELIRGASLVVANDSAAVHIAAAVGTRSLCILGGGHFGRFHPYPAGACDVAPVALYEPMRCYGCNWVCTEPHHVGSATPCVTAVGVEAVLAAARGLLSLR